MAVLKAYPELQIVNAVRQYFSKKLLKYTSKNNHFLHI
jgi:hypothetical protein